MFEIYGLCLIKIGNSSRRFECSVAGTGRQAVLFRRLSEQGKRFTVYVALASQLTVIQQRAGDLVAIALDLLGAARDV